MSSFEDKVEGIVGLLQARTLRTISHYQDGEMAKGMFDAEMREHRVLAKAAITAAHERDMERARKQTASDILTLANEYAREDKTMVGAEKLRGYHYFNAINKIGGFNGR